MSFIYFSCPSPVVFEFLKSSLKFYLSFFFKFFLQNRQIIVFFYAICPNDKLIGIFENLFVSRFSGSEKWTLKFLFMSDLVIKFEEDRLLFIFDRSKVRSFMNIGFLFFVFLRFLLNFL